MSNWEQDLDYKKANPYNYEDEERCPECEQYLDKCECHLYDKPWSIDMLKNPTNPAYAKKKISDAEYAKGMSEALFGELL